MKFIAYSCLLVVLIVGCNNMKNKARVSRLSVHTEILLAGDDISCPFDTLMMSNTSVLKISLKNLTRKAISFWMMNCTWHDSFIFDVDNVDFYRTSCTRNFPEEFTLEPNDSIIFTSLVQQKKLTERPIAFKVGFINFSEEELKDLPKRHDKNYQSTKEIIWSNSVTPNYKGLSYRYK